MHRWLIGLALLGTPAFAADLSLQASDAAKPSARGVLKARQSADIAANMSARLTKAGYADGAWFERGATLAAFDCTALQAEIAALEANVATLKLKADNARELLDMGAAGELDVAVARSEVAQGMAQADVARARKRDCTIAAPFSGWVVDRHLGAHETPSLGQPIYSVIRAGKMEMELIAPSSWLAWASAGDAFEFSVDETGETFRATITRMGASVDPVSQTVEINARPDGKIKARPGMSGVARFTP